MAKRRPGTGKKRRRTKGLQEGIYHAPGVRPAPHFTLACVDITPGAAVKDVHHALCMLWKMLQNLKRGKVADLPRHPVPHGELTVLLGVASSIFDELTLKRDVPEDLHDWASFPGPDQHDHLTFNSGIPWATGLSANPAATSLCLQCIATTGLASHRPVVEMWKLIHDHNLPLQLTSLHQGFSREDRRSWIDFHDGISNMRSPERQLAISIAADTAGPGEEWTYGGTYLTFIKLGMDLTVWRGLSRTQQEMMIGRDKLSGVPLVHQRGSTQVAKRSGCPLHPGWEVVDDPDKTFHETTKLDMHSPLGHSHVHRANHHQDTGDKVNSLRIFRQGYEFLEDIPEPPGFRPGLHFVSFQDTPERVFRILDTDTWLGGVNFAGYEEDMLPGMERFLDAHAAGVWFIPPQKTNEAFPGEELFIG